MSKGSFKGLYTFLEVAEIYNIDDSCLRKQVAQMVKSKGTRSNSKVNRPTCVFM